MFDHMRRTDEIDAVVSDCDFRAVHCRKAHVSSSAVLGLRRHGRGRVVVDPNDEPAGTRHRRRRVAKATAHVENDTIAESRGDLAIASLMQRNEGVGG